MVSGDDDDLAVRSHRLADRPQHRFGDRHRLLRAPLHQLDDVAEEDQPVDALERGEQALERRGSAQHVVLEPRAEVQIGDEQGAHAADDSRAAVRARSARPQAAAGTAKRSGTPRATTSTGAVALSISLRARALTIT